VPPPPPDLDLRVKHLSDALTEKHGAASGEWRGTQRPREGTLPTKHHITCPLNTPPPSPADGVLSARVLLSGKDDVLDIEIDSYIHCISAFVKLAQSEYALLVEVIPEHHQKKTFDSLIQVRGQRASSTSSGAARRIVLREKYSHFYHLVVRRENAASTYEA